MGKLVILSGPSGVGKDTVINEWHRHDNRVQRVVAYTTRHPRPGELPEVDYHFVDNAEFIHLIEQGAFLEWKEVHGNFYATPLYDMEVLLETHPVVCGVSGCAETRPTAVYPIFETLGIQSLLQCHQSARRQGMTCCCCSPNFSIPSRMVSPALR